MDGEILQVLKEIRDETRGTNARLDQTNARLEALESRTEFLERRVTAAFEKLSGEVNALGQRITDEVGATNRRVTESELRLSTAVTDLAAVTRQVHDILVRADLRSLSERVTALEEHARNK
jgi:SMC interacting uncharacterized protein involved in chromosome segregation